jgi:hypothetical protein
MDVIASESEAISMQGCEIATLLTGLAMTQ